MIGNRPGRRHHHPQQNERRIGHRRQGVSGQGISRRGSRSGLKPTPDRVAYLAMIFAAKEAIFKTFGIGWETGVQFKEIEVRDGEHGEPIPVLTGRFAELASERDVSRVLLSLSYDGDYAVAVATLSK